MDVRIHRFSADDGPLYLRLEHLQIGESAEGPGTNLSWLQRGVFHRRCCAVFCCVWNVAAHFICVEHWQVIFTAMEPSVLWPPLALFPSWCSPNNASQESLYTSGDACVRAILGCSMERGWFPKKYMSLSFWIALSFSQKGLNNFILSPIFGMTVANWWKCNDISEQLQFAFICLLTRWKDMI